MSHMAHTHTHTEIRIQLDSLVYRQLRLYGKNEWIVTITMNLTQAEKVSKDTP